MQKVLNTYNPLNLPGFFYICDSCQPNTIPSEGEGNYKRKSQLKVSFEDTTYPGSQSSINKAEDTNGSQNLGEIQVDKDETAPSREEYENPFEAQWVENPEYPIEEEETRRKENEEIRQNNNKHHKKSITCRFFINGKCKHGIKGTNCNFNHPKLCRKFTQHGTRQPRGCNLGKKCKYLHPKMCFDSLRKGECFSESCRYNHVKGTIRHPPTARSERPGIDLENPPNPPYKLPVYSNDNHINNESTIDTSFLEVINMMKQEILQTFDQKIKSIQNQMQQLQQVQTIKKPQLQTFNTPMMPPPIFPWHQYPQQILPHS